MVAAVVLFLISWALLTAALVMQHITDKDGVAAIIWAFVPTFLVIGTLYLVRSVFVDNDQLLPFMIAGGLFILATAHFLGSLRRYRKRKS